MDKNTTTFEIEDLNKEIDSELSSRKALRKTGSILASALGV